MGEQENPYADTCPDSKTVELNNKDRHEDIVGNLELSAKVVRVCSVGCGLLTVIYGISWVMGFYYLPPFDWTWIHVIHCARGAFLLAICLFTWRSWRYANAIKKLPVENSIEFGNYVECQAKSKTKGTQPIEQNKGDAAH